MTDPQDDKRADAILDTLSRETGIGRDRLTMNASLAELEVPSLDVVQSIFALEEQFGIEVPVVAERGGAEFTTVGDLVKHVLAALDTQHPGVMKATG